MSVTPNIPVKEASIPASSQPSYDAIVRLTDTFCQAHLTHEYQMLCRKLAAARTFAGLPAVERASLLRAEVGSLQAMRWRLQPWLVLFSSGAPWHRNSDATLKPKDALLQEPPSRTTDVVMRNEAVVDQFPIIGS